MLVGLLAASCRCPQEAAGRGRRPLTPGRTGQETLWGFLVAFLAGPIGRVTHSARPVPALLLVTLLLTLLVAPAHAYYQRPGNNAPVSITSDGTPASSGANRSAVSADGRYIAFESSAGNLAPGLDTHSEDQIYVHDRATGATEIVSVSSAGDPGNDWSTSVGLSADGRFVVFESMATNLVTDEVRFQQVYVHDRATGTTELVSRASDGTPAARTSFKPVISADGRYVAFQSYAANLVSGTTPERVHIYLHDRSTGEVELVSRTEGGTEANNGSAEPSISSDGRFVSYNSLATNLVGESLSEFYNVFVFDRETGATEHVSVRSDGTPQDAAAFGSAISGDGRFVAFHSNARNFVPANSYDTYHVYVHDRETDITERVSISSDGVEGSGLSMDPAISDDGRFVTYMSFAFNLTVEEELNERSDIYVYDRGTRATDKITIAHDGGAADGDSLLPDISGDGSVVVFETIADNLIPDDNHTSFEIFARDRGPATGIGDLAVEPLPASIAAQGWATFSGAVVSTAESQPDAVAGAADAGITSVDVTYRAEREDLLFRTALQSLSRDVEVVSNQGRSVTLRSPAIVYGWAFDAAGASWEVRVQRLSPTAAPETLPFDHGAKLLRCDPDCVVVADLRGGVGTAGTEVRAGLPLAGIGLDVGEELTNVRAFAAPGELTAGHVAPLAEVGLPNAEVPMPVVTLGIAPAGTPEAGVSFNVDTTATDGTFSGSLDTASLAAGSYDLWARACLAHLCGARAQPFVVEGDVAAPTDLQLVVDGIGVNRVLTARLTDRATPPAGVPGKTIDFYGDGTFIGWVKTDDHGVATLPAAPGYRGGSHDFEARFAGDDVYLASSAQAQSHAARPAGAV